MYTCFFDWISNSCREVVSQLSGTDRQGTCHGDLFPAFRGTEESQGALPAFVSSKVESNMPLWDILGQSALGPSTFER